MIYQLTLAISWLICTVHIVANCGYFQEIEFFFGPNRTSNCPISPDTTLAIIKPHASADRVAGSILSNISKSFELRSAEIFNVNKVVAGEFYEVYRGVVAPSEFTGMVEQLTSGPCLVMELAAKCAPAPDACNFCSSSLSFRSHSE